MAPRARALLTATLLAGCATSPPPPGPAPAAAPPPSAGPAQVRPVVGGSDPADPVRADACPRTPHRFVQPLVVTEDRGLSRYPAVIGAPIAFPRGGDLRSMTGFTATTLGGEVLATQTEVLSRWGDAPTTCEAPIRWGYLFAAGEVPPKQRAFLQVKHEPGPEPRPPVHLSVDANDARVVIDTGPARFTVNRAWFNGLSRVELRDGEAWRTVAEVPSSADAGMLVLHRSQLASPINGEVLSFEIERAGPVVATVAVKGTYAYKGQPEYYRYTLRLHFYAGASAVQLDHTFYNGQTQNASAEGAKNRKVADRVFFRLPLKLGEGAVVQARGATEVHGVTPTGVVSVEQGKRTPERPDVVFAVGHDTARLELGTFADRPFVAAVGPRTYAIATQGFLGVKDPAAIRYDPRGQALEIDWQSEEMFIGGAKGIWGKAAFDFGAAGSVDMATRGDQLYAHVTRPLVAVPNPAYLNTTHAYGALPTGALEGDKKKLDEDVDRLHARTVDYLRRYRITGAQIWPDLARDACSVNGTCDRLKSGYFEGGDDNYWDWSLVELEQFLRTADPAFLHDFALAEAITMAETVSFRPNWYDESKASAFGGLSPCYGTARGWGGPFVEGLTHRTGNCPGDYSYNKVHRLAYLLTADRRFTDLFTDGARTAIRQYGLTLKDRPPDWRELSASRQTAQYVEPLLTAAEFGRIGGAAENRRLRDVALKYFDFMAARALQRGHTCSLLGSGHSNPATRGSCTSIQQWMMPILVDWIVRLHYLYDHAPARDWLLAYVRTSTEQTTVLDGDGHPDISAERGGDGWRTLYTCEADARGVRDDTCEKVTDYENQAYYYPNGLVAYLNALAMVKEVDPEDTAGLCAWLPDAYDRALARLRGRELNDDVWGKSPGQAYAFAQRALGALEACAP